MVTETQERSVLVKHAYNRVYDAFWGNGWMNWTRFLVKKGTEVLFIKGTPIDKDDKKLLLKNLPVAEEE